MTTTNDLLEYYILDLWLGINSIKEEYLPGEIILQKSEFTYIGLDEGYFNYHILNSVVCTCNFSDDENNYEFTEFGKTIMNIVLKAYLENIAKTLN